MTWHVHLPRVARAEDNTWRLERASSGQKFKTINSNSRARMKVVGGFGESKVRQMVGTGGTQCQRTAHLNAETALTAISRPKADKHFL